MQDELEGLKARMAALERRTAVAYGITALALATALGLGVAATSPPAGGVAGTGIKAGIIDEVRTRKLVVVDDQDRVRATIDQDGPEIDRYARSAGLTIYDMDGRERGGIATIDDGSAVIALDSPWGVGSPMRDRAGAKVFADGTAMMGVLSNRGEFAAILRSDGDAGHLDLHAPDDGSRVSQQRTLSVAGEETASTPMATETTR